MKQSRKPHNDWLKRIAANSNNLSTTTTSTSSKVFYSPEEVAEHNQINDAWMIIADHVYDVTEYMDYHPGGIKELMKGAGKDATEMIKNIHPWVNLGSLLQPCYIGKVETHNKNTNNLMYGREEERSTNPPTAAVLTYIFPSVSSLSSLSCTSSSLLLSSRGTLVPQESISSLRFRNNNAVPDTIYRATQSGSLCIYPYPQETTSSPFYATWFPDNLLRFGTKGNGIIFVFSTYQFLHYFGTTSTSSTTASSKNMNNNNVWYKFLSSVFIDHNIHIPIRIIIDTIDTDSSTTEQCLAILKNQWFENRSTSSSNYIDNNTPLSDTGTPFTSSNRNISSTKHHIILLASSSDVSNNSTMTNPSIVNTTEVYSNRYVQINQMHIPQNLRSTSLSSTGKPYRYWNNVIEELLSRQYILPPHAELLWILFPASLGGENKTKPSTSILHDDDEYVGVDDNDEIHVDNTSDKKDDIASIQNQEWLEMIDTVLRTNYYLANNTLVVNPNNSR